MQHVSKTLGRLAASVLFVSMMVTTVAANEFVEPDYGFKFTVDSDKWNPAPIPVGVLGEPCAVLTSSPKVPNLIVVFVRSSPKAEPNTDERLSSIQQRLTRIGNAVPGGKVVSNEIKDMAGRKVVSFRVSGPGTGLGLDGRGSVTTVQHWIVFPRAQDLIVFQATASEQNFADAFAGLSEIAGSVKIEDSRPTQKQQPRFDDQDVGLSVDYPAAPWIRGGYELGDHFVPGYLLRLWSAPSAAGTTGDGTTNYATRLSLFLQFPGREFTPQQLLDISVKGLTQSLGAEVKQQELRNVAGMRAMWLVVEGKSKTGANITGQGDVATRQLWLAIPRVEDGNHNVVVFVLNTPTADYATRENEFAKMLKSLKITGSQSEQQRK